MLLADQIMTLHMLQYVLPVWLKSNAFIFQPESGSLTI